MPLAPGPTTRSELAETVHPLSNTLPKFQSHSRNKITRIIPPRRDPDIRVAQTPNPAPADRRIKVQTRRCIPLDLAEEPARAPPAVARLAVEEVPPRAGLVDRVRRVVHGHHVQVEGVVAVVEGAGAIAGFVLVCLGQGGGCKTGG